MPLPAWMSPLLEIIKTDDLIDKEYDGFMRKLVTYMMEDPRTITSGSGSAVHRQGDRAHRRPRQEPGRMCDLHRQRTRCTPYALYAIESQITK